ncbi:MAG: metallophosphoesterase [Bryobacteraceae bacterium]
MITFVHLSDIHFSPRDDLSQFDLDRQIRRALLEDLERRPADGAGYDGLLITGDIAFAGKHEEYQRAQVWLDEVFTRTGASAASTYVVPGNHDVDRAYVEPEFPLWDSHVRLREAADPVVWRDIIAKQLQRDPLHTMLAPLRGYNDFAQGYECRTEPGRLAWWRTFWKALDDGRPVRLHGLNSALVSDAADAPGKLLVSEFQTSHFEHSGGVVDVVLCHHPPEWLLDKGALRNALRTFVPVVLFGHEHSARIAADVKQVQLFAGAVQPSRRDPEWLPTYHIVQLIVEGANAHPELIVRTHTREFDKQNYQFRSRRNEDDEPVDIRRVNIPAWTPPVAKAIIPIVAGPASEFCSAPVNDKPSSEPPMPTPKETAQRELLVQFFRLRTPDRYTAANEAGLLRDGDDALNPQTMWAEVFRRATEEPHGLARFWTAVASRTPTLKDSPNPFVT